MTETIRTDTVTFDSYKDSHDDSEIRIFISGFEPTYAPIIVVKGQPKTMQDLIPKLEYLLGVEITLSPPHPPK